MPKKFNDYLKELPEDRRKAIKQRAKELEQELKDKTEKPQTNSTHLEKNT